MSFLNNDKGFFQGGKSFGGRGLFGDEGVLSGLADSFKDKPFAGQPGICPYSGLPLNNDREKATGVSDAARAQTAQDEEQGFSNWIDSNTQIQPWLKDAATKENPDYDYKGFYKENPSFSFSDPSQHLSDKYKRPNHVTFSNQSQYSTPGMSGGEWKDLGDNKFSYTPSADQLKQPGYFDEVQRYFPQAEQGNLLNMRNLGKLPKAQMNSILQNYTTAAASPIKQKSGLAAGGGM